MKSSHRVILSILLSIFCVAPVFADSDSFYCTGKGYIAFDLRSFIHPDLKSPHVLRLFRFGSERGIYKAADWPMKDFEIHGMWCMSDRVVVTGSEDARYTFDIPGHENRDSSVGDDNDVTLSEEGQLGWSVAGVKTLESSDEAHKYQLVLSNSTKDSEVKCTAELLQIDSHQKVTQRVLLYERQYTESGD